MQYLERQKIDIMDISIWNWISNAKCQTSDSLNDMNTNVITGASQNGRGRHVQKIKWK